MSLLVVCDHVFMQGSSSCTFIFVQPPTWNYIPYNYHHVLKIADYKQMARFIRHTRPVTTAAHVHDTVMIAMMRGIRAATVFLRGGVCLSGTPNYYAELLPQVCPWSFQPGVRIVKVGAFPVYYCSMSLNYCSPFVQIPLIPKKIPKKPPHFTANPNKPKIVSSIILICL